MTMHRPALMIVLLASTVLMAPVFKCRAAAAENEKAAFDTFTVYWENDIFAGTDRDYTNGLKLSWSTPFLEDRSESKLPDWSYSLIDLIPFAYNPEAEHALSLSLGQNIYTPEDTMRTDLIIDDRPYAGHVYVGAGIHTRSGNRKQIWEVNLGIIGPASQADEMQMWLHEQSGSDPAEGWANQLENEPTLDIVFESKWRLRRGRLSRSIRYDLISHLGGRVGNVAVSATTGAEIRAGFGLPDNFGICTIRGGCEINSAFSRNGGRNRRSFYLFTSVDGQAVAHDIFLDGNTFRDSHSVDKENLVGELIVGFAFETGRFSSTYSYIFRSRQYASQGHGQQFGAITVTVKF